MELKHIDLSRLSVSGLNMRGVRKTDDIENILPSVRARGILVPLIVREKAAVEGASDEAGSAFVMGETLEAGSALIEYLGLHLNVDMATCWQADDALLDNLRDREVLGHLLAEVAGDGAATANAKATAKVQRGILKDCLEGTNGRTKVESWVPGWMAFPPRSYTERGGVGSVERAERIAPLTAPAADPVLPLAQAA